MSKTQIAYNIIKKHYFNDNTTNDTNEKSYNVFNKAVDKKLSFLNILDACTLFNTPKVNNNIMFECGVIDSFMLQRDYGMINCNKMLGAMLHIIIDINSIIYYANVINKKYKL